LSRFSRAPENNRPRHASGGDARQALLDGLPHDGHLGCTKRDPKRIAVVRAAAQLPMMVTHLDNGNAVSGERGPVGCPAARHAEPLPRNGVAILHARVTDVDRPHSGMAGDLSSDPVGVRGDLFHPQVVVLTRTAEFETEMFDDLEVGRPFAYDRREERLAMRVCPLRKRARNCRQGQSQSPVAASGTTW
jgi:hypothetical protein